MNGILGISSLLAVIMVLSGCRSTYYAAWEKLGKHKRDLLKDNVEQVRDDQQAAAEQFKDALTRLRELYSFDGGDLEKTYDQLQTELDRAKGRADTVKERIGNVETIASDLFEEWAEEAATITNPRLRQDSEAKLRDTRRKYESLHEAMKRAENSMEPVLLQLGDQVTYLKHNLNAQAIGALKGEVLDIEKEVQQLIRDMNASIAQADAFISGMP